MIIIEIIIRLVVVFFDPAGFPSKQNKIRLENKRRATKSEVRTPKQNLSQNSRNTVYLGLCVNVLSVWTIPMLHVAPRQRFCNQDMGGTAGARYIGYQPLFQYNSSQSSDVRFGKATFRIRQIAICSATYLAVWLKKIRDDKNQSSGHKLGTLVHQSSTLLLCCDGVYFLSSSIL